MKKLIALIILVATSTQLMMAAYELMGTSIINDVAYVIEKDETEYRTYKRARAMFYDAPSKPVDEVVLVDTIYYNGEAYPVTSLEKNLFKDAKFSSINIPATVINVRDSAFFNCSNLTSVKFLGDPGFGSYVFENCTSLKSIDPPFDYGVISKGLFKNCISLSHVNIPANLKEIRESAFYNCYNLKLDDPLPATCNTILDNAFYNCRSLGWDDFSFDGEIGSRAFYGCKFKTVTLSSFYNIDDYSFEDIETLEIVKVQDSSPDLSKQYYNYCPFTNCKNLKLIISGNTMSDLGTYFITRIQSRDLTVIAPLFGWRIYSANFYKIATLEPIDIYKVYVEDDLTVYDSSEKEILMYAPAAMAEIPATVKEIGSYAFKRYPGESVVMSDNVGKLGYGVFADNRNIHSIILSDSIKIIRENMFANCTNLESVKLPEQLEETGICLFKNCTSLHEIHLPENLLYISDSTFYNCTSLTTIDMSDMLRTIGDNAFARCQNLCEFKMPDGVTTINKGAFYQSGLSRVEFSKNLNSIGSSAFDTPTLKEVNFPADCTLTQIPQNLFSTTTITSLRLPDNVTSIGSYAFPSTLKEIFIPGKVKTFQDGCFQSVAKKYIAFDKIAYNSLLPKEGSKDLFSDEVYETCTLEVPVGSFARFVVPWKYFRNIVENPDLAGVDDVTIDLPADDAPVEYYDMQGRRVEHPSSGLYIRRQGPKAEKVLLP